MPLICFYYADVTGDLINATQTKESWSGEVRRGVAADTVS